MVYRGMQKLRQPLHPQEGDEDMAAPNCFPDEREQRLPVPCGDPAKNSRAGAVDPARRVILTLRDLA
jgi:hypothetical protein